MHTKKSAANLKKRDPDFFRRIGRLGGKANIKAHPELMTFKNNPEKARELAKRKRKKS